MDQLVKDKDCRGVKKRFVEKCGKVFLVQLVVCYVIKAYFGECKKMSTVFQHGYPHCGNAYCI